MGSNSSSDLREFILRGRTKFYLFYVFLDNLNAFHGIFLFVDVSGKQVYCCGDIYSKDYFVRC